MSWSLHADSNSRTNAPSLYSQTSQAHVSRQLQFLGRLWLRFYLHQHTMYNNVFVQTYVRNLVRYLWQFGDIHTPGAPYVFVTQNTTINAFAAPGKIIGVHTGLLQHVQTESQFASVLAHEIGHLRRQHFLRSQKTASQTGRQSMLYFLGGLALLLSGSADSGVALVAGSSAHAIGASLRYSRLHEKEADRVGLRIIQTSRFNNGDFISMLRLLERNESLPDFFAYMQTHPLPRTRIAEAQQTLLADIVPTVKAHYVDSHNFLFAQSYVMLDALDETKKRNYCKQLRTAKTQETTDSATHLFRLGLCASHEKNTQAATEFFAQLHQRLPRNHAVLISYAQALHAADKLQQATRMLQVALQVQPNQYALVMTLADLLLAQNKTIDALQYLQPLRKEAQLDNAYWHLLARTYAAQKQPIQQLRASAQGAQLQGKFKLALLYLARAEKQASAQGMRVEEIQKEQQHIERIWDKYKRLFGNRS